MDKNVNILNKDNLEFVVFCIENIATKLGISGDEAFEMLDSSGLLYDYIVPNYDVLHTQSKEFIVDDIIEAMRARELI